MTATRVGVAAPPGSGTHFVEVLSKPSAARWRHLHHTYRRAKRSLPCDSGTFGR